MDKSILKNKKLDDRVTGFLIPQAHRKSISPLIISDGFVHGWAFDPLRTTITVALSVDGLEQVSGLTGYNVADEFYAQHTPPTSTCGFVLPLPNGALDGFIHQLTIKVAEWRGTPLAPEASETWHHGNIFGEVKYTQQGFVEGWVGFRSAIDTTKLPPVSVGQDGQIHYAIQLAYAAPASPNGCQVMGQFRVPQSQFVTLGQPVFSCLGALLRLHPATTPRFKPVGQIDAIDHEGIHGWALNSANPLETVDLQLVVDGLPLRALRPNVRRKDIADYLNLLPEEIGISGFHIGLPVKLKDGLPHTISVYCRKDGTALNKQPLNYQHTMHGINLQQAQALLGKPGSQAEEPASNSQTVTLDISKLEPNQPVKQSPQVAVIILNRNGARCLEALFDSWLRYNTTPVELIVIDHTSSDASLATIKRWARLPIQTVVLDKNDSFSASSNRGARLAKAPFVLFLNNDIILLQDILPSLLDTLDNQQVGAVGLKLLKTEFAEHGDNASLSNAAEVQHLGVRFTLVDDQYWPYETSPDSGLPEEQYSPQDVPIVTGAVMLCRRDDFLAMGGFDEGYFYGYEDVEFCLRMSALQGKRSVCRNDLVALHHHGYTRLTGREPSMIDHQFANQTRLAGQLGLWSKRTFWQSLLDIDNLLTNEILTIGFAIHNGGNNTDDKNQLTVAVKLAEHVCAVYPNAKVVFLTSENGWNIVGELHVLVSLSPYFDLRCIKEARADLRTAYYITHESELNTWSINPGLDLFDACLCVDHALAIKAEESMRGIARPVAVSNKTPLADLLDANRLRVQLRVPSNPKLISAAKQLAQALKEQGALVCKVEPDTWHEQSKVVEVVITLHGSPTKDTPALSPYERRNDVINVLWIVEDADSLRANELTQADQVWLAIPKLPQHLKKSAVEQRSVGLQTELMQGLAEHLQNAVEKKIERTFRTS